MLLLGRIHSGIVQGAGQALVEGAHYSSDGQILTAPFMGYAVPRADGMPSFKFETRNVPSTSNQLGIKGVGEVATIGATPAVKNAVIDALHRGYGVKSMDMPTTPSCIREAIQVAGEAAWKARDPSSS